MVDFYCAMSTGHIDIIEGIFRTQNNSSITRFQVCVLAFLDINSTFTGLMKIIVVSIFYIPFYSCTFAYINTRAFVCSGSVYAISLVFIENETTTVGVYIPDKFTVPPPVNFMSLLCFLLSVRGSGDVLLLIE